MVRILHTADIHLDSPLKSLALRNESLRDAVEAATRMAFRTIVETAIAEHAEALLIAGDLFDGKQRSARTAVFLIEQLDQLRQADIKVFYIKGNHDAENQLTGALDLPDNVHVFTGRGGKVQLNEEIWIHGVSFTERHAPESLLPRFSEPVPGAVNIALLHTSLGGAQGHDVYAPCTVNELKTLGFDYWALGHVHKRQIHSQDPWVVMPGMPQGRDIGEAGPKSATLLTINNKHIDVSEIQTSVVEFINSSVEISNADTDDVLRNQLRNHMKSVAGGLNSSAGVLRLELQGAPKRHWQFLRDSDYWREQVSKLAQETECLWIDKLKFSLEAPNVQNNSASAIDELGDIISQIQKEPGFNNTAQEQVSELIQDLPPEVLARMLPDENSAQQLTQILCDSGAKQILARMKGADN